MPEWWTYTISDFVHFSARAYYRVIERHNESGWPAHLLALGLGLAASAATLRAPARPARALCALVAVLWAGVAWTFFGRHFAAISWTAAIFAWLFAIEAALVAWIGAIRAGLSFSRRRRIAGGPGLALLVIAVPGYPVLAPLVGRDWRQAEIFGVAADPTAIATLGHLLLADRLRWELLAVPILWGLISGVTLWGIGSPTAWVPPLASMFALTAALHATRRDPGQAR